MRASWALLSVVWIIQYSLPFFVFLTFTSLNEPDQLEVRVVLADGRTTTVHQIVLNLLGHDLVGKIPVSEAKCSIFSSSEKSPSGAYRSIFSSSSFPCVACPRQRLTKSAEDP